MSSKQTIQGYCPKCKTKNQIILYSSIHCQDSNEQKLIKNNQLNRFICSNCNHRAHIPMPVMYHKVKEKYALWYEPEPNNNESKAIINQALGNAGNYLANAERINDWKAFKFKVLNFEKSIRVDKKREKENVKNLMDYIFYLEKHKIKLIRGWIRCKKCGATDIICSLKGKCFHCQKALSHYGNIQLMHISLLIFKAFLKKHDEYLNLALNEKLLKNIKFIISEIKSKGNADMELLKEKIINPLLELKQLGGQKVGGVIKFTGNQQPTVTLFSKNEHVLEHAPYNLSAVVLAFDYIRQYGLKKKSWWKFW